MAGFIDQINAMRDTAPQEERLACISREMDSLWEQGVVAMADISNCDESFALKKAHPMYTRSFLEVFGTEPEDCAGVMEGVLALQQKALALGLDAAPTPHACYTMSPQLLMASAEAGLHSGFLSYHSEETPDEEEMIREGRGAMWDNRKAAGMSVPPVTGTSSLQYFLDLLVQVKPAPIQEHVLLVHECCLDKEGAKALKEMVPGAYVAVCPLSNLFIHNLLPPIPLMREEGLRICVGTDSLSSNDLLSPVAELYCLQEHFPEVPLGELLTWASRNGAEFLGRKSLGTLEAGKRPGLVFIDHLQDGRLTANSRSRRIETTI
jgi:cytosine/adenosine deaminase-related metal-dependent hydrolase